jgi:hypothetical protein
MWATMIELDSEVSAELDSEVSAELDLEVSAELDSEVSSAHYVVEHDVDVEYAALM